MKVIGDSLPRRFKAKASGAITAGKPLIVQADGDVAQVAASAAASGTAVVFESASLVDTSVAYDSNAQKVVISYNDAGNSYYGTAIVGTVDPSNNSISYGTAVVFESASTSPIVSTFDSSNNKIVIAYKDGGNSNYGTAIVGTVSGTSISFGSATVFESANSPAIGIAFDANAGKVVIVYSDNGNGDDGTAIVGTVSGTSISFGSASVYETSGTTENVVVYDANAQKVVIAYKDNATFYGAARVGTVSGTSISFGTEVVFESATITHLSGGYDSSAQKVVFSYQDGGNSDYGTSIVGTVSGTDISFGTAVVFESADSRVTSTTYDSNAQKVVVAYKDDANSGKVTVAEGTVSGTSISFATPVIVEEGNSNYVSSVYDSNASRTVIAYRDGGNSDYGTAVVFKAAGITLTAENYIGIAEYAAADTETATVLIKGGVSTTQSSLTPGQTYFVQRDGTIGTTAATPSVTAGTAVTSTKLIVKG
jgi:hypothetical protein